MVFDPIQPIQELTDPLPKRSIADPETFDDTVENTLDELQGALVDLNGDFIPKVNALRIELDPVLPVLDKVAAVGGSIANVNTVAGSINNVNTTAGNIQTINTAATNIQAIIAAPAQATAAAGSAARAAASEAAAKAAKDAAATSAANAAASEADADTSAKSANSSKNAAAVSETRAAASAIAAAASEAGANSSKNAAAASETAASNSKTAAAASASQAATSAQQAQTARQAVSQMEAHVEAMESSLMAGATAAPTPNTPMKRDAAGRSQVVNPAADADIATKIYVDARTTHKLIGASTDLNTLFAAGTYFYVDSGIPANAPPNVALGYVEVYNYNNHTSGGNVLQVVRDRCSSPPPVWARGQVGGEFRAWTRIDVYAHGVPTSAPTPWAPIRRDAAGRAQVAAPAANADIVRLQDLGHERTSILTGNILEMAAAGTIIPGLMYVASNAAAVTGLPQNPNASWWHLSAENSGGNVQLLAKNLQTFVWWQNRYNLGTTTWSGWLPLGGRQITPGNMTLYIEQTGNDNNAGTSVATALKTWDGALKAISRYDTAGSPSAFWVVFGEGSWGDISIYALSQPGGGIAGRYTLEIRGAGRDKTRLGSISQAGAGLVVFYGNLGMTSLNLDYGAQAVIRGCKFFGRTSPTHALNVTRQACATIHLGPLEFSGAFTYGIVAQIGGHVRIESTSANPLTIAFAASTSFSVGFLVACNGNGAIESYLQTPIIWNGAFTGKKWHASGGGKMAHSSPAQLNAMIPGTINGSPAGFVILGGRISIVDPVDATDAATKGYVDTKAKWMGATKHISTAAPAASLGADGDVYFQYV